MHVVDFSYDADGFVKSDKKGNVLCICEENGGEIARYVSPSMLIRLGYQIEIVDDNNNAVTEDTANDKNNANVDLNPGPSTSSHLESQSTQRRQYAVSENPCLDKGKQLKIADRWSDDEIKYLLNAYGDYYPKVGKFKSGFDCMGSLWTKIAKELHEHFQIKRTMDQCKNKFASLKRSQSFSTWANSLSGNTRHDFKFSQEFEHLLSVDETILPETIRGAGIVRKTTPQNSTAESATALTSSTAAIATKAIPANTRNDSSSLPSTSSTTRKNSSRWRSTLATDTSPASDSTSESDSTTSGKRAIKRKRVSENLVQLLERRSRKRDRERKRRKEMKDEAERRRQRRHEDYIKLHKSILERIFPVPLVAQDNVQREARDNDQDDEDSSSE